MSSSQPNLLKGALHLLLWTLAGTASAIVFGVVLSAAVPLLALGGVTFLVLMLGAFAGAIGGPVFGAAYGVWLMRCGGTPSRGRSILVAGVLGGLTFAAVGAGYQLWLTSERAHQPTKSPVNRLREVPIHEEETSPQSASGTVVSTPDGGVTVHRVTVHRDRSEASTGLLKLVASAAGVTGACGLVYGLLFGFLMQLTGLNAMLHTEDTELSNDSQQSPCPKCDASLLSPASACQACGWAPPVVAGLPDTISSPDTHSETFRWIQDKVVAFSGFLGCAMTSSIVGAYVRTFHFMDPGKFDSPVPNFMIVLAILIPVDIAMAAIFLFLARTQSPRVARRCSFVAAFAAGASVVVLSFGAVALIGGQAIAWLIFVVLAPCAAALVFNLRMRNLSEASRTSNMKSAP